MYGKVTVGYQIRERGFANVKLTLRSPFGKSGQTSQRIVVGLSASGNAARRFSVKGALPLVPGRFRGANLPGFDVEMPESGRPRLEHLQTNSNNRNVKDLSDKKSPPCRDGRAGRRFTVG
ncbi:MAG: hypothetical protein NUV80_03895 [Candidatus Berkelbacteria bacterium]|nr:hypothetical protein [Candidatus Berkelbacteria bacterium]